MLASFHPIVLKLYYYQFHRTGKENVNIEELTGTGKDGLENLVREIAVSAMGDLR